MRSLQELVDLLLQVVLEVIVDIKLQVVELLVVLLDLRISDEHVLILEYDSHLFLYDILPLLIEVLGHLNIDMISFEAVAVFQLASLDKNLTSFIASQLNGFLVGIVFGLL